MYLCRVLYLSSCHSVILSSFNHGTQSFALCFNNQSDQGDETEGLKMEGLEGEGLERDYIF
jgi:hypothetical protein